MATFIAISGASVTGKTSLVDSLSTHQEMSKIVFSPDFHTIVWNAMKEAQIFSEFIEITKDSYYICTYLHKLAEAYNEFIESYEDYDGIVMLDGCWIDLAIYAQLTMWYNRIIKPAQDEVFDKILKYSDNLSRVYITKAEDSKYPVDKNRIRGRKVTFQENRPLEIKLYQIAIHMKEALPLEFAEISGDSIMIIEDLKKLGYI